MLQRCPYGGYMTGIEKTENTFLFVKPNIYLFIKAYQQDI